MASDIAKPNMDGLNRAGEQGDLAAAGGKQANLKLAQQFMALAQSDNAPVETQVSGQGQITIDTPQNKPAPIGGDRIDWGIPEIGPGLINPRPPIFGPGRPPFLPPNIIPGRPITLPPNLTLGQSISMPTGTFERVDGEWIYTPREPDVTIGPIDPPTRITDPAIFEISSDGEWYFSPKETAGDWTFEGSGQSAEES